jgi:hypothetical protein
VVLPWMHRVFSNLKTWALEGYHGLRPKYLQSYLDPGQSGELARDKSYEV